MTNFLNEEIERINFLFGYKKGVVISEQIDSNVGEKIKIVQNMKEKESDPNQVTIYDQLIDYYTKIEKGESPKSPNPQYTDFIDSKFSLQTQTTNYDIPELPKAEEADLGNAPEEIIKVLKEKEDKRAVGFATSSDPNIAKKNATNQAINKLYEKLGSQQEHQIVKDMRVGDTTYVVVGEL